jgi:hypothetical protein
MRRSNEFSPDSGEFCPNPPLLRSVILDNSAIQIGNEGSVRPETAKLGGIEGQIGGGTAHKTDTSLSSRGTKADFHHRLED